jgi:hypothetical protein
MAANAGEEYMHLAEVYGPEMAGKIARFTLRNLEKMQELIEEYDAVETSEMQRLNKLRVFMTEGKFEDFKRSIARLEADHPSMKGIYTIVDSDTVLKVGNYHLTSGHISDAIPNDYHRSTEFMELLAAPCFRLVQYGHTVWSPRSSRHS